MSTFHTDKYYSTREHLLEVYDECSRKYAFRAGNVQEYEAWKKELREVLSEITGMNKMKKCGLTPEILESKSMNGYRRDKIIIQTENKVWMPFYALIPEGIKPGEKRACIIAPHGHSACGKEATVGNLAAPAIEMATELYNCDYGLKLVREGYIVLCPDARGTGERRENFHQGDDADSLLSCSCTDLNNVAIALGRSLIGQFTWDLMRLIDYAQSLDNCDPDRIGCCGFSGGGFQTLWLAAMDDRVKCAVISGSFYSYRDTLLKSPRCGCKYAPHLWEYVDTGDLGALAAPKAVLVESGVNDPGNGMDRLPGAGKQFEIMEDAYVLLGKNNRLERYLFEGKHEWSGDKTYEFLRKWL